MVRTKLKCLCLFLGLLSITCSAQNLTSSTVSQSQFVFDEDDTIVVEAEPSNHRRYPRQADYLQGSWTQALGEGAACLASSGLLGSCMSFQNCYSYYKFPLFGYYDPFLANYDQCTYFAATGHQEFGVCCTNQGGSSPGSPVSPPQFPQFPQAPQIPQIPQIPQFPVELPTQPPTEDPVVEAIPPLNITGPEDIKQDWPPPIPTHPPSQIPAGQWPPPIPTHPPDHTSPTHPPRPISPFPSWPPQTPSYPSYPTYPTRPPSSPISPFPGFPSWPPTTPQKPPTTKPPPSWPPTQKPPSWPPTTKPPAWPPTTKPPAWPPTTKPPAWPPTTKPPAWPPATSPPAWPPTTKPPAWPPATSPPAWPPTTKPPLQPLQPTQPPSSGGSFQAQCGAKNGALDQERIVGGQNASPNEWPWIVVLFNNGRQFCGGSLMDNLHILTAAHCVAHMSSWDVARLKAHLGDHNIKSANEVQHVERSIKRVVRHRGFDSRTLYNDVAILTMDRPVEFTQNIKPICLPSGSSSYTGKVATVIGWGSLRENGQQPSVLQKVSIPIWTNQDCAIKYGPAAPGGIIETMLCAGQPSRDSCSGDSGGPLMINEGRWVQVGIVSWGIGCGKGQYPGVYSRVTHFLPWIQKNLEGNI